MPKIDITATISQRIGITTTIPQEVIWASGNIPVDLNNVFISSLDKEKYLARAYRDGFPRTSCPWIAGIYGAIQVMGGIDALVVVMQGDCSNTHALAETLEDYGLRIIPFAYPYDGDYELLEVEIRHLADSLGAPWDYVLHYYKKLRPARKLAAKLDELTWKDNKATGWENHRWLVETSDFGGDIRNYEKKITTAISEIENRVPLPQKLRLAYVGVPPIFPDIFDEVEKMGARIVFCETQRQFSLPLHDDDDIVAAYTEYTYPQSIFQRIEDIKAEITCRDIHGIIHYVQSFCFRQIEDLLFRRHLDIPILTIEGENNFELDERTRVRLEAFVKMLED